MGKCRKRPFSLFEMLLVMAILSIALGTLGFSLPKLIRKQSFEKGVEQVIEKIYLAQEAMQDCQLDLTLFLEKNESGKATILIQPDFETSNKLHSLLNRHTELSGIEDFAFNGIKKDQIRIHFEGRTGAMSSGELELMGKSYRCLLNLKGFPTQIKKEPYVNHEKKPSYPEEILSAL